MQEYKFICFTKEELSAIISAALDEKFPPQSVSNNSNSSDLLNTMDGTAQRGPGNIAQRGPVNNA
jgi:hypothetical protein